jgi:hypothetical protein
MAFHMEGHRRVRHETVQKLYGPSAGSPCSPGFSAGMTARAVVDNLVARRHLLRLLAMARFHPLHREITLDGLVPVVESTIRAGTSRSCGSAPTRRRWWPDGGARTSSRPEAPLEPAGGLRGVRGRGASGPEQLLARHIVAPSIAMGGAGCYPVPGPSSGCLPYSTSRIYVWKEAPPCIGHHFCASFTWS